VDCVLHHESHTSKYRFFSFAISESWLTSYCLTHLAAQQPLAATIKLIPPAAQPHLRH
jgi:hypothetical protein